MKASIIWLPKYVIGHHSVQYTCTEDEAVIVHSWIMKCFPLRVVSVNASNR